MARESSNTRMEISIAAISERIGIMEEEDSYLEMEV